MGGRGGGGGSGPGVGGRARRSARGAGAGGAGGSAGGGGGGGSGSGGGIGNSGTGGVIGGGGSGSGSGGGSGSGLSPSVQKPETLDQFFEFINTRQAREWANKHWGGRSDYPKTVGNAIYDYSTSMYEDINSLLRQMDGDWSKFDDPFWLPRTKSGKLINKQKIKSLIERIDKGMEMKGAPQWVELMRGTSMREFEALGIDKDGDLTKFIGQSYTNRSYTSSSLDRSAAFQSKPVQIKIKVPPGTKSVHMAGDKDYQDTLSMFPHEEEVLLGRDTEFTIVSAKLVNGKWIVEVVAKN